MVDHSKWYFFLGGFSVMLHTNTLLPFMGNGIFVYGCCQDRDRESDKMWNKMSI